MKRLRDVTIVVAGIVLSNNLNSLSGQTKPTLLKWSLQRFEGILCAATMAVLLSGILPIHLAAEQPVLQYLDFGPNGTARVLVADSGGNVYVIGSVFKQPSRELNNHNFPDTDIRVMKHNPDGQLIFNFTFGGTGYDQPLGAAVDQPGNVYVAGSTRSNDFPLVNAVITRAAAGWEAGFLSKIDAGGAKLLFSTLVGGTNCGVSGLTAPGTAVNAVAVDAQGNPYITGYTSCVDFPVTANAFQRTGGGTDGTLLNLNNAYDAFVTKFSAAGECILYSTYLGGKAANCRGGSSCLTATTVDRGLAIAVDSLGIVTVAGVTNARDFPVTPGAFQSFCKCFNNEGNAFISRINLDGSVLLWSTLLGGSHYDGLNPLGSDLIRAVVLDGDDNVIVAGTTETSDFPVTAGALQINFATLPTTHPTRANGFVTKLNGSGTALLFSTYLGGQDSEEVSGLVVDEVRDIWITGHTASSDFPLRPGSLSLGDDFVVQLDAHGSRLLQSYRLPTGSAGQGVVLDSHHNIIALGEQGSVLRPETANSSESQVSGIANSAGFAVSPRIAPGEMISIYGVNLGPEPGLGLQLSPDGQVATELGGIRVLFDGKPASLVYAGQTQINAVVPYGISSTTSSFQVTGRSGTSQPVTLRVAPTSPGIFHGFDSLNAKFPLAAAINEDGTINSGLNPAPLGTIVALYASGAGQFDPPELDGTVTFDSSSKPVSPVRTWYFDFSTGYKELDIPYAGAAPGLISGVLQVNIRVPEDRALSDNRYFFVLLQVGDHYSEGVTLRVR